MVVAIRVIGKTAHSQHLTEIAPLIVLSDGLTIYLWFGKTVTYLTEDSSGGSHIYGFNGKHLGWFVGGVIRDHKGDAACAVKEVMQAIQIEPFKAFKEFKTFKTFTVFSPFRPDFSNSFSQIPSNFFLASGAAK
jgi:hypothetical protein